MALARPAAVQPKACSGSSSTANVATARGFGCVVADDELRSQVGYSRTLAPPFSAFGFGFALVNLRYRANAGNQSSGKALSSYSGKNGMRDARILSAHPQAGGINDALARYDLASVFEHRACRRLPRDSSPALAITSIGAPTPLYRFVTGATDTCRWHADGALRSSADFTACAPTGVKGASHRAIRCRRPPAPVRALLHQAALPAAHDPPETSAARRAELKPALRSWVRRSRIAAASPA